MEVIKCLLAEKKSCPNLSVCTRAASLKRQFGRWDELRQLFGRIFADWGACREREDCSFKFGGEEEFKKKAEEQGYTKDMFKHIREIEHLKSQIYGSEDFSKLDNDKRVQLLSDIITEVKKEAVIKWNWKQKIE